jgi:hypothetical protein
MKSSPTNVVIEVLMFQFCGCFVKGKRSSSSSPWMDVHFPLHDEYEVV